MVAMQMIRPLLLLRHEWGGAGALREGKWIIERMLSTEGGMPSMTQQPLLIEPQIGNDKGILIAKMNVPRTKNALSRALVQQVRTSKQDWMTFNTSF
jgi:hypothetical protein